MNQRDDDRFRIRPGAPKQRGDAFVNNVLRQANKAGAKLGKTAGKVGQRASSRLGRGHVAARFAGRGLGANARRVTIKTRLVNLAQAGPRSTAAHLRYIEREGVDRQGGRATLTTTDDADLEAFKEHDERRTTSLPPRSEQYPKTTDARFAASGSSRAGSSAGRYFAMARLGLLLQRSYVVPSPQNYIA